MRLLIVTQAVDSADPALGFFHSWLLEFAKHTESLTVICLYEGTHSLPENVTVHSLGKEGGIRSPLSYAVAFKLLAWKLRSTYDTVFVHMNPEYLMIAGSMWKLLRKRTALWYLHKTVSWRLRLGVLFADHVFTASEKSMRLKTKKKRIVGHGIDSSSIALVGAPAYPPLHLLSVGRISRVKRTHLLIETLALLLRDGIEATLTIVGAPATKDGKKYEHELHEQAEGLGARARVLFMGPVQHAELGGLFEGAHLFLHASGTGSLDKASLEPLLAGVPIITVDDELASAELPGIILATPDAEAFAGAVRKALGTRLWDDATVREASRAYVMEHHELERLVPRMLAIVNS